MIVEFTTGNYRSINRVQTLSFKATDPVSQDKNVDAANIVQVAETTSLKIAAIYGANGSGKSNILEALQFFSGMMINSIKFHDLAAETFKPFIYLDDNSADKHSGYFQIVLIIERQKYRYGFTLALDGSIRSEWLFGPSGQNETYYYKRRKGEPIEVNGDWFAEGINLPFDRLRADSLFLTFCSAYNGTIASAICGYFTRSVSFEGESRYRVSPSQHNLKQNARITDTMVKNGRKEMVLQWLREIGIDYDDIDIEKNNSSDGTGTVKLYKNIYADNPEPIGSVCLTLDGDESAGTRKYYRLIGLLIDKFENGGLVVSDQIDNNLHPSVLKKLISFFQNPGINKANAQLLFTSHDTNLMNSNYMRRDQVYFAEKTKDLGTRLYSLSDLKGIPNNADFAKQYLNGAYGALPTFDSI